MKANDPLSLGEKESNPSEGIQSLAAPVIDRSPLPMVEVEGKTHTIRFVNPAFCRLLKKLPAEVLGKEFSEIVFNGEKCQALLDSIYETGAPVTHLEPDTSEDPPAHWLYAMWPTLDGKKQPVGVVIQLTRSVHFRLNIAEINGALLISGLRQHELRDLAEQSNIQLLVEVDSRKRVEQSLRDVQSQLQIQAEQLENTILQRTAELRASIGELEAFSYSLVHDLRAPIRAINGFTHLVLEMPANDVCPGAAEYLKRIVKATVRMDSLIQDVLSLNEVILKPMDKGSVDVDALVRALIEERPELSPANADITIEGRLSPMWGHEASLGQCVINLLNNAVKFVEPKARPSVRIWSELIEQNSANVAVSNESNKAGMVRLWIEDKGIGIAPVEQGKIFKIFQRLNSSARYEGTGIGLAIVRKAIERMGGTAGVDSEAGQGSRFWLELPRG